MRPISTSGAAVFGALLLVSGDGSIANNDPQPPNKGGGAHPGPPAIVHHSPAIGGALPSRPLTVQPQPVRPPVNPQPAPRPVTPPPIVHHTPALGSPPRLPPQHVEAPPVVKRDVKSFVEQHKDRFVGPGQKLPAFRGPDIARAPNIADKIGDKAAQHVVSAYHKELRDGPIKVGNKAIEIKRREELAASYRDHWKDRINDRYQRAYQVRHELAHNYDHLFAPRWWDHYRNVHAGWWGRWPRFAESWYEGFTGRHHWGWWRPATWPVFTAWYAPAIWGPPLYYDYGGNVVFQDNIVYVDGTPVASEEDYYRQAKALAARGAELLANAPPSPDTIEQDWMPLGVWSVANETQDEPTMFLQLAVNKNGVIGGTFTNTVTNEALPVTGAIDPNTQRAAWYIGDNTDTVMETGAYNLTQTETPVLVHFGPNRTQTWLMVRMPDPDQD